MKIHIKDTLQKEEGEYALEHTMFKEMISVKSQEISKRLQVNEVTEIELILVNSTSKFSSFLVNQTTEFSIAFKEPTSAGDEHTRQIMTIHPKMTGQLFQDPKKEYEMLLDYALHKLYLFEKYGKNANPLAGYFNKYALEMAAQMLSGKFLDKIAEFEIKMYSRGKKFHKKELEVAMLLYIIRENSGKDFIYDNLDTIFTDCDIKKSMHSIYKKNFDDFLLPLKEELLAQTRAEQDKKKKAWQDQRRLQQQVNLDKL